MTIRLSKLVAVGDPCTGKSCMLKRFAKNKFVKHHICTIFENYPVNIKAGEKYIQLSIWDTSGSDEYNGFRSMCYPFSDVILLCFAINSRTSYNNVKDYWIHELNHYCPTVPIVLIGTKCDLREEEEMDGIFESSLITVEEGEKMASDIDAVAYIECSARSNINIRRVFEQCTIVGWYSKDNILDIYKFV